jgi:hypothetical protein
MRKRQKEAIVIADMNVEGGEETSHHVKEASGEAIFVKVDVTKVGEGKDQFLVAKWPGSRRTLCV